MSSEWQNLTVDQIKAKDDRAIAIGPFGSRMKADTYVASGVPVIRGNNISDTRVFVDKFVYVSEQTADELRACNVFAGDLVFPHRGAIGQVGIIPSTDTPRFMLSTSLMKLTCNQEVADPLFVFYFFRSALGRHALLQHASTVGTPGIGQPLTSLRSIRLLIPPLPEQRTIAHILGTLDDKIELNRRRNQTLEAMARVLFKDWFVDFGPVRAKMEGREPYLPADLWQLFPERLDDEGKPEGWETKRVSDFLVLSYGKSLPSGKRHQGSVPVYGSGGITGFHDESLINGPSTIIGRKGTVGSLYWEDRPCFPIDTVFYVQPAAPLTFCYYLLESLPLRDMNTDAAVPGLNRENVYRLELPGPSQGLISRFAETALIIRENIASVSRESETLTRLRDTLLPKLISGELRIADAAGFLASMEGLAK